MIFTNCNVCGIKLRTPSEDLMGMCDSCAAQGPLYDPSPPADPNLSCDQCSKPQWDDGSGLCSWRAGTEFGSCDGRQVRSSKT